MRVILMGSGGRAGVLDEVARIRPEIAAVAQIIDEDFFSKKDFSRTEADLAIVFGGDGAVLRAAHQMGTRQIPIIAVNLGTLAFLAGVQLDELLGLLRRPDLLELPVTRHLLYSCSLMRNGGTVFSDRIGLNEVCVGANDFGMIRVELFVDEEAVANYRCDGLILSTPVGSTAHNLSAGGPILRKDLDAFVISPISPHTLSHRPVVDSAERRYTFHILSENASLSLDGTVMSRLTPDDRIEVKRAKETFKILEIPGHSYYRTLREKLGWSGDFDYIRRTGK